MESFKAFLHKIKCFFIAVGVTVRKAAKKIFSPEVRPGLRRVGRMLGSVLGFFARVTVIAILVVLLTGAILGVFGAIYITKNLDVNTDIDLEQFSLDFTSHILARDPADPDRYVILESLSGNENRIWVPYAEFPRNIVDAVVAIEDKRFWDHEGVDWKRTVGAFYNLFRPGGGQFGGSTITQQLIKNLTGEKDATVSRKLQEIFRALAFERRYPGIEGKELILENYLNTVYFGSGCYGVMTAAEEYFGKPLEELTLAECAALIGITNNPSFYNPYTNPKNNKKRQEVILGEMFDQKIITRHEYNLAKYQPLNFSRRENTVNGESIRSWYADQVIRDVTADLMEKYNWSEVVAKRAIYSGGMNIYACVDLNIQTAMDEIWADDSCWPNSPDAEPAEAAMMVVDHTTGEIKAMIGGREKTGNLMFDRSTMAKRQPGSAIKPLTVYVPAFDLGLLTPYSTVDDIPLRDKDGRGWPLNSPSRWEGRMTVLQAVTVSKNTTAVSVVEMVGLVKAFNYGKDNLGLTSLVENKTVGEKSYNDYGDSAALSMGALTDGAIVRDMVGGYATIANKGLRNKTRTYSHITDQSGGVIFENISIPTPVIKEKTAFYMETCLINVVAGGTGTYAKVNGMPTAGKTGTTSANKDRWFAGYTPYYTAVCWFGYDIGRDMSYYNNNRPGNPALHMWVQVMNRAHEGLETKEFEKPDGIESYSYCIDSGMPPGDACRLDPRGNRVSVGWLDKDDIPRSQCNVHKTVSVCTLTNHLATPDCPPEVCKTSALLNVQRWSPVSGFSLPDEQYMLRTWGEERVAPEGWYPVIAAGADGASPYNAFCDYQHPADQPPPGEGDGEDGESGEGGDGEDGEDRDQPPETPVIPEPGENWWENLW